VHLLAKDEGTIMEVENDQSKPRGTEKIKNYEITWNEGNSEERYTRQA
jgi:hypothetical protein